MFEPLEEYAEHLERTMAQVPGVTCCFAAAADGCGTRVIHVHPDFMGSSLLLEAEEQTDVNGVPRAVRATTVDQELASMNRAAPLLMKVDVQGAELSVLAGAEATLKKCEVVILETTLFNTFMDGPLFHEVVAYMAERDFCVYEITGQLYRPLDGALMQVDVVFVPRNSALRRYHAYATADQRAEQTRRFVARMRA
jgi:FkbM family methyltransferase